MSVCITVCGASGSKDSLLEGLTDRQKVFVVGQLGVCMCLQDIFALYSYQLRLDLKLRCKVV